MGEWPTTTSSAPAAVPAETKRTDEPAPARPEKTSGVRASDNQTPEEVERRRSLCSVTSSSGDEDETKGSAGESSVEAGDEATGESKLESGQDSSSFPRVPTPCVYSAGDGR